MWKRTALSALLLTVLLAGCSGSGSGSKPADQPAASLTKPPKEITIEYWTTPVYKNVEGMSNPNNGDWEQAKINEFMKANPNVKINFQLIPADAIEQKVTVAVLGNKPPDILLDGLDRRLMKYVKFGKSEPLDDVIQPDLADYNKSAIEAVTKNGKIYGIPISLNAEYMFLNKKLFVDKGLENLIPKDRDWTFEEWKDAMKKVSGDGIYGTAFFAGNEQADEMLLMYLFGMGAEQWNADSTEVVAGKYKESADVLQTVKDMVKDGSAAPGPATLKALDVLELFKQGKIAMMPWAQALYSTVEAGQKDGTVSKNVELYGIKPVHKDGVTPKTAVAISGYTVFKQDDPEKRDMIKKFLRFITTPENVKALSKSVSHIPARTSSAYEYANADMTAVSKLVQDLPQGNLGKVSPYYNEVRALWFPALQSALQGNQTPQQAIEDFTTKANKTIKELEQKNAAAAK